MKRWLPVILIFLFIALSFASARAESLTFDEIVHMQEGVNALTRHTFFIDTNNPPLIRELAMLPTVLGLGTLVPPRAVTVFFGALTLIAVYFFTKRYFGRTQAVFALFLLALEPTFLANSHYVTLDTGVTLFVFLAYMAFVRLMERYSIRRLGVVAITWGLAFSSKITAIPFLVISTVVAGLSVYKKAFKKLYTNIFHVIFFICITGFVIWAAYFFTSDVLVVSREDAGRVSSRLYAYALARNDKALAGILRIAETQKLPLRNYLAVIKNTVIRPQRQPKIFFLGQFYPSARWYFMVTTFLLKVPIPLLVFFILGLCAQRRRRRIALFAIPVFAVLVLISAVNIQPWVRYMLPVIPFVAVVASESLYCLKGSAGKILVGTLCIWFAYGTGTAFPHYISYVNEFAGQAQSRYRILMDSNLDWGQSLPDFERYIQTIRPGFVSFSYFGRDNGDRYGLVSDFAYGSHRFEDICAFHHINLPYASTKIMVAISVSNWYYCGYNHDPQFENRPVVGVVGGSILIF